MPRDLTVTPVGWLSRGEAFVPGQNRQLAIFGAIPGEAAAIRIFTENNHQVRARVVSVARPHPRRVKPPCPKWGPCAGCPWMHLDEAGRIDAIRSLLAPIGAAWVDVPAEPGVAWVIEVRAGRSDTGQPRIGVPARDGPGLVAIPGCLRADPGLRAAMSALAGAMIATDTWPFDGRTGNLAGATIRRIPGTDGLYVVLDLMRPGLEVFAEKLASMLPEIQAVVARRPDGEHKRLYGSETVEGTWLGERFRWGLHDDWPISSAVADVDRRLAEDLGAAPEDAIVDLGEGSRGRSLHRARVAGWALGVEIGDVGLVRARELAAKNRVGAEFVEGIPGLIDAGERLRDRRPLVHVGLGHRELEAADRAAILGLAPRKLALGSDNPKALAKEVAAWKTHGFELATLRATEVMPWSAFWSLRAVLVGPDAAAPVKRAPRRRAVRAG